MANAGSVLMKQGAELSLNQAEEINIAEIQGLSCVLSATNLLVLEAHGGLMELKQKAFVHEISG